ERTSGTILRTGTHVPLRLTSTLLLRMITLSVEPFFNGHKHCSPLQPLRARHALPVSLSSLVIRWITPTWKVWSEQNSKTSAMTDSPMRNRLPSKLTACADTAVGQLSCRQKAPITGDSNAIPSKRFLIGTPLLSIISSYGVCR